jgi:hypothetical protein
VRRIVFALLLCSCVAAQASEETWYSVHLDGRKIGHMRSQRTVEDGGRVRHEQALELSVERSGDALRITSQERSWESSAGAPLAFEADLDTAGSVTRMSGVIADGKLTVVSEQQGRKTEQRLAWPRGALLPEGQRLAAERAGYAPGTEYAVQAFDPGSLQAFGLRTRVGAPEKVLIHAREETLIPLQQTLIVGGVETVSEAWVDLREHNLRRLRLPALGLSLDMLACDRACALAPVQPLDIMASILVPSPRMLLPRQLQRPLYYRLRVARGGTASLDRVPGQRVRVFDEMADIGLLVDPRGEAIAPPQADDLGSNRWLQSDAPEVQALAREAASGAQGPAAQVAQLERFVRSYITTKSLRVGYASAREIVESREGDCTEHAVLLAALVRALGIPARVATGIAYAPQFGAQRNVFVPHAWVMAWIDGEWRGFDAALARFDAGHIAFSLGDGDPFRFYGGIELLGGIEIVSIERAPAHILSEAKR